MVDPFHQLPALAALVLGKEAAQDGDDVHQAGLLVAQGQVTVLEQVKIGVFLPAGVHYLFAQLGGLLAGLRQLGLIVIQAAQGVDHIFGGGGVQGGAVIHGSTGGLGIELEEHTPQGGLAAAALTHHAHGFALVDVNGDVLVGPDVQLLLLENGALGHGEVFFQITD